MTAHVIALRTEVEGRVVNQGKPKTHNLSNLTLPIHLLRQAFMIRKEKSGFLQEKPELSKRSPSFAREL